MKICRDSNESYFCYGEVMGRKLLSHSPVRKDAIELFCDLIEKLKKECNSEHQRVN